MEFLGHASHEDASPSHDESQPTSDHQPSSDDCGHQCICKGAVVEDGGQLDIVLDTSCWVAVALAQPLIVDASALPRSLHRVSPPPGGDENPGRTLCCLYELYLC